MSNPLVKIANNQLSLIDTANIPDSGTFRVVSILGKARMGKSTFLNAILSRIGSSTVKPFKTQDNDEHCTRGIDYYFCEKERLLLLDCQGLALEDSSHDPQLLLFAYLVSDVLILNERMMLQNEALKLMEPICGFMTYVDMEGVKKPQLYFRISDADLVKDPKKNLERVLTRYPDQYQSIRDSIANLFQPDIGIVKTETMDRALKRSLQVDDYMCLFEDQLLGFRTAVDTILASLPEGRDAKEWNETLTRIIHGINHNEKISIDKLDIVRTLAELEISQYKNAISPDLFTHLPVTAFQNSYDMLVVPRIEAQQNLLADFNRKFKSVSKEIKEPHFQELSTRLNRSIETAKHIMLSRAEQHVASLVAVASQDRSYLPLDNIQSSFQSRSWDTYLAGFQELQAALQPLYEPVRTKYENWMKTQRRELATSVRACVEMERELQTRVDDIVKAARASFLSDTLGRISEIEHIPIDEKVESILWQNPVTVAALFVKVATTQIAARLCSELVPLIIHMTMSQSELSVRRTIGQGKFASTHDLIAPAYKLWTDFLTEESITYALSKAVTERKKKLLFQTRIELATPGHPMVVNRITDIDFVSVQQFGYMTVETFEQCYMPLVKRAIQQLDKKGYLVEGDVDDFVRVDTRHCNPGPTAFPLSFVQKQNLGLAQSGNVVATYIIGAHPEPAIAHLFKHAHSKVLALERAKTKDTLFVVRRDDL